MDFLKHAAEAVSSPLGLTALLLLAGTAASFSRRRRQPARRLLLAGAALFLAGTFTPLAEILVWNLERDYPPLPAPPAGQPAPWVVVLSGYGEDHPGVPGTSALSGETIGRLSEGVRLYRLMAGSKLVLSGGRLHKDSRPVSVIMAEYLKQQGIPAEDILTEERSLTTYENMVEIRKILGDRPFILVTSALDLRRALAVARKQGMQPIAAPARIWMLQKWPRGMSWPQFGLAVLEAFADPSAERWTYLQLAYHEYLGYAWYGLLGRL